jgi:hypothetical protein
MERMLALLLALGLHVVAPAPAAHAGAPATERRAEQRQSVPVPVLAGARPERLRASWRSERPPSALATPTEAAPLAAGSRLETHVLSVRVVRRGVRRSPRDPPPTRAA